MQIWCTYWDNKKIETRNVALAQTTTTTTFHECLKDGGFKNLKPNYVPFFKKIGKIKNNIINVELAQVL